MARRRRLVVVQLAHREAVGEHRADLVNLTAERVDRRPAEMDLRCRDCDKVFGSLPELVGHYDSRCRSKSRRAHPSRSS